MPFFQDQDESIMKEIVEMLQSDIALQGQTIIHEGQNAERMFFINVGSVHVMAPHALYHVAVLEQQLLRRNRAFGHSWATFDDNTSEETVPTQYFV